MAKSRKQSFTFNTFSNGLSTDPTKWKTHGYYSAGVDLFGIKDIGGTMIGGRPNVLQLAQQLKADAISASSNPSADYHLTGLVEWIRRWDGINTGDLYALCPLVSAGGGGVLLRNVSGTTTWVSAAGTSVGVGGGGLQALSANLYIGQDTQVGQLTSALTYNPSLGTFTLGKQTPRPMKVFAGVLNIGNDRYISTVDSTGTFVANALSLPAGYIIRSLEVLGNYLVISADFAGTSRIFLWTGGTATFQEAYDIPELNAPTLVSKEGRVFAIGSQIYQLNEVSFTVLFSNSVYGTPFPISPSLSVRSPILGETAVWRNRILYSIDQPNGGSSNFDDVGGVWSIGNSGPEYPFVPSLYGIIPVSGYHTYNVDVGGIYADHTSTLKVGYQDDNATAVSARFKIATMDTVYTGVNSPYAYYLTLPINFDTDVKKIFHSIRLTVQGDSTKSCEVDVYYRLDTDWSTIYTGNSKSDWTLLRQLTTDNTQNNLQIPIHKQGKNIMFKFALTPATGSTPQVIDYTIVYELMDQYR